MLFAKTIINMFEMHAPSLDHVYFRRGFKIFEELKEIAIILFRSMLGASDISNVVFKNWKL